MNATSTYADAIHVRARVGKRAKQAEELANLMRQRMAKGVLAFPLTAFSHDGAQLNLEGFRHHMRRHIEAGAAALFVACGTGEFSSLDQDEYAQVIGAATDEAGGEVPVFAGVGYGWPQARRFARIAEQAGSDGLLVLPHYLVNGTQEGITTHFRQIADATACPLIVYQRGLVRLDRGTLAEIAQIPTVIGLKDGQGDLVSMQAMTLTMPEEFLFFNGALTAEVQHRLYASIGVRAYSSAFHSCVPEISKAFFQAFEAGQDDLVEQLLREVYIPFTDLRAEVPGYAVSLIKAAAGLRGEDVGPVRAPLQDPHPDHLRRLEGILRHGLDIVGGDFKL